MRFSVVTISFNQAQFVERAVLSVLTQKGVELEYIIVDPGSTDGRREIIERYRTSFSHVIFNEDEGPADGLNKGFARATGEIFCYLNSDDEFELGAFQRIASFFASHPEADVVCGHSWVVDQSSNRLRRVWSDPYDFKAVAYGTAIQMQASTFFRGRAFRRIKGFSPRNRIAWDGELLLDLALSGARIDIIDEFLSLYRVHAASITGAALHRDLAIEWNRRRFERLIGRPWAPDDDYIAKLMFLYRQLRNPWAFLERLCWGKVYGRSVT
jgi:glycosyltransferase involved in cell wall biosynthesis